jgi:hypothetical protein
VARKVAKRRGCFAKRNELFRKGGRKALKSLGCEIDDFVQSCVFNGLMSVSFRRVSPFRPFGQELRLRRKSGAGLASIVAGNSEKGKDLSTLKRQMLVDGWLIASGLALGPHVWLACFPDRTRKEFEIVGRGLQCLILTKDVVIVEPLRSFSERPGRPKTRH